ncbi:hypothetical protein [Nitrosovibrio sp. Nv6]|uniref:hypothetical protein n=1 Tax=Nitrosovibrio sp. Nv6 TaxID=1855340 RepID=UPI0008CB0FB1|nr:hypothetical protein [Nitrosovibrio sp. Nv6]SEP27822.1 hypothetical protein SAMN05216316_2267 [Nitrosovibrio sp. Nv6]
MANEGIDKSDVQVSVLWLEELERSHHVLKSVIASLPADARREFIEFLQILAEGVGSQELGDSARGRAHQIVAGLCKQDQADNEWLPDKSERRAGDRRIQDRRQEAGNSHKPWAAEQIQTLQILAEQKVPVLRIARKLGRTSTAIKSKAKEINLPLSEPSRK